MLLGTAHHFAIGSGAFREGRIFSNFEGISGWGCETSECMVLSSCCGQQANFFSKMLTYKRAYSGVKIIIVRARPGPQLWYFLFSHRAEGKLGSRLYALSKALIAFRFCTRIGPTGPRYCHAHPPATMFRYRIIGVRKTAAPKRYALPSRELLFPSCPHWHQFVVPEAVYKWWKFQSVPSEN